jgi:hypothetical protein
MNCAEARDLIQSELDGELPLAGERSLGGHLAACGECRRLREEIAAVCDWAKDDPPARAGERPPAGPVIAALRAERRRKVLRRTVACVTAAAAAVLWASVLPGLLRAPSCAVSSPAPPPVPAPAPAPPEVAAAEPDPLLHEWKAFVLTGETPARVEARLARVEHERRTAERLLKPAPVGEKPIETEERMQVVRRAAAVAAAEMGARGIALLEEAARDPRRAPEVLAGVTGQSRAELLPVFITAMYHRNCRQEAATLAREATGLELGSDPALWRAWWEGSFGAKRSLTPIETAGAAPGKRRPKSPATNSELEEPSPVLTA